MVRNHAHPTVSRQVPERDAGAPANLPTLFGNLRKGDLFGGRPRPRGGRLRRSNIFVVSWRTNLIARRRRQFECLCHPGADVLQQVSLSCMICGQIRIFFPFSTSADHVPTRCLLMFGSNIPFFGADNNMRSLMVNGPITASRRSSRHRRLPLRGCASHCKAASPTKRRSR